MEKRIKKQIEKALRTKSSEFETIINDYYESNKSNEKGIVLYWFYFKRLNYWRTQDKLQARGFYFEKSTFYRIRDDIIIDIALRACYEGLICPYRVNQSQLNQISDKAVKMAGKGLASWINTR